MVAIARLEAIASEDFALLEGRRRDFGNAEELSLQAIDMSKAKGNALLNCRIKIQPTPMFREMRETYKEQKKLHEAGQIIQKPNFRERMIIQERFAE